MVRLLLTSRALQDIESIREYSTKQWGKKTADKYLDDVECALSRLQQNPELLQLLDDLSDPLRFYRVNKHVLICDVREKAIVVLTLVHASMDLPNRLANLQPTLAAEVELLHQQLQTSRVRRE